jgi:CheY-like chemotaxis protein
MTVIDPAMDMGPAVVRGRDLAMLGHDVRCALQSVLGGLGQIEAADLPQGLRAQVERAATAGTALGCLVGILLGDEPDAAAGRTRVDVERLLRHLRRRYAGEAEARGLGFEATREPDVPGQLRLDLVALARVLGNLIGNALQHGGGTVRLAVARAGDRIAFRVTDEGPGLPEAFGGVFSPVGEDGPAGLGLRIAGSLTERLGGTLEVRNRAAGGAEAVLSFPPEVAVAPAAGAAPERADLAGLRVLLAEDNPTNQMVATQMLKALNAEVSVAADGVEALERFEAEAVDLVVVDIEMPRLSGLDVIRAIRARGDARARTPIVALTAYAMREHRDRIAAAGADGLISKPITSVEALGRALAAHAARSAATPAPAESETAPVVDAAVFDALAQAIGADMMAELLDKVIADLMGTRHDLAGALDTLDLGPIRSASHILISVAGALGATRLHACARTLNAAAHAGRLDGIEAEVRRCIDEIDLAVAFARDRRAAR